MSIYSNFMSSEISNKINTINSFESFLNFVYESNNEVESIFEQFDYLIEGDTQLSVIKQSNTNDESKSDDNAEKVKKTIIQKIKELFDTFVGFVKKIFINLSEIIKKKYMETNLSDKFFSRYKNIVKFNNLQTAREKGWKGIPINIPSIGRLCDYKDSSFYRYIIKYINEGEEPIESYINIEKDIDPIIHADDLTQAKEIYKEFENKLSKFDTSEDEFDIQLNSNERSSSGIFNSKIPENPLFATTNDRSSDGKFYYPNIELFATNKMLAEEGERKIKELRAGGNDTIKNMKTMKVKSELKNMKSFKKGGINSSKDKESDAINILYYKAKYKFASAVVKRQSSIIKLIISVIKKQQFFAIQNYLLYVQAIKKYVPNATA